MAKRKLSSKLKAQIDASPFRIKKADLSGEALEYLLHRRSVRKGQITKEKRKGTVKVGATYIPANTEISRIVKASAKAKGMTVKAFVKKYKKEVEALLQKGHVHLNREVDYIIVDMGMADGIHVNGNLIANKTKAKYYLQTFKRTFVEQGKVYPIVNIEYFYDLVNNMFIDFPLPDEYENFANEYEGEDLIEHWRSFIDKNYPKISYIPND
jgi:hypothetical protein